jgi:hypothetical protein
MGSRKRKRLAPVLSTASAGLLARGQDPGPYRTPVHVGDPHACDDSYAVEGIMAEMLVRGIPRYRVKWQGINDKLSTWEVAENLQDDASAAILAEFKSKQGREAQVRDISFGNVFACPNRAFFDTLVTERLHMNRPTANTYNVNNSFPPIVCFSS